MSVNQPRPISNNLNVIMNNLKGVKRSGEEYRALCPAHNDRNPSLSLRENNDGKVIMHCHAGCSATDVMNAIGMDVKNLFGDELKPTKPQIIDTYRYVDENGIVLYCKDRYDSNEKKYIQYRLVNGEKVYKLGEIRRVLYNLPLILSGVSNGKTIYIVEGEKDAKNLVNKQLIATTDDAGAWKAGQKPKWRTEFNQIFKDANVVILPDKDEPGQTRGKYIASVLKPIAKSVKYLELPGNGKDVTNWLESGGTSEQLAKLTNECCEWQSNDWFFKLECDKNEKIIANPRNVELIFDNDPNLKNFKYNVFSSRYLVTGNLPGYEFSGQRNWSDADDALIRNYFNTAYGISKRLVIDDGFKTAMLRRAYHPVKEYLNSLPAWDGVIRIPTIFTELFGTPDSQLINEQAKIFFTGAIARIMEPGIKFDFCPVFTGAGGTRKTSAAQLLALNKFYTSLGGALDKSAQEKIQGAWIVEIDELSSFRKSEMEQVKSFITERFDRFRPAYGHYAVDHPRSCVFIGTTNEMECIQQSGGGERRFWPIQVNKIADLESLDVNQIWAEALYYYNQKIPLFLSNEMELEAAKQREAHFERPDGMELITEFLDRLLPSNWESMNENTKREWLLCEDLQRSNPPVIHRMRVTALEIWTQCLLKDPAEFITNANKKRELNKILRALPNWDDKLLRTGNGRRDSKVERGFERKVCK